MYSFVQCPVDFPEPASDLGLVLDVQLNALRAPRLQLHVAHLALDRGVLVVLQVHVEVGAGQEGLVEAQGLAGILDDGVDGGLRRHVHARAHADAGGGDEDLVDAGLCMNIIIDSIVIIVCIIVTTITIIINNSMIIIIIIISIIVLDG